MKKKRGQGSIFCTDFGTGLLGKSKHANPRISGKMRSFLLYIVVWTDSDALA